MERPLRDLLEAPFGGEDAARVRERIRRSLVRRHDARRRRVRYARVAGVAAIAIAVVGGSYALSVGTTHTPDVVAKRTAEPGPLRRDGADQPFAHAAAGDAEERIAFDDGSSIVLTPHTRIDVIENNASRLVVALGEGRALFDVRPHGPRAWTIDAGLVAVDVLGTRFTVESESERVRVSVERGVVRVRSALLPGGARRLVAAQHVDVVSAAQAEPAPETVVVPAHEPRGRDWRALVAAGDYDAAFESLDHGRFDEELAAARDSATLFALADAARLSGHPAEAVEPLTEIMDRHARDPRASVAAFTRGRIELESLGRPADAARSFDRAIELGLPAALEEPAYARLVEAYERAGNPEAARAAAARRSERFP